MTNKRAFRPNPDLQKQLATNRTGKFTPAQKTTVILAAIVTGLGLLCLGAFFTAFLLAVLDGTPVNGFINFIFLVVILLMLGYLALTLFVNFKAFFPDTLAKDPIRQSRGKLEIRMPQRERDELPFSYIVGDYSFAPFMVHTSVPMDTGREYIVYYAASSRMFLGIEPVDHG